MRLNLSVDTSIWDTPVSNREVAIEKQCDFVRKEIAKYKTIQYVHCNEKGISVSYGENADKPFLLGQTWFFYHKQKRGIAGLGKESTSDQYYIS